MYVYSFFSPSISASFLWSMLKKHKPCKSMINLQNFRLIYRSFWSCFKSVSLTVPLLLQHTYLDLRAAKYQWLIEGLKISHLDAQKTFLELKSRWKKVLFNPFLRNSQRMILQLIMMSLGFQKISSPFKVFRHIFPLIDSLKADP